MIELRFPRERTGLDSIDHVHPRSALGQVPYRKRIEERDRRRRRRTGGRWRPLPPLFPGTKKEKERKRERERERSVSSGYLNLVESRAAGSTSSGLRGSNPNDRQYKPVRVADRKRGRAKRNDLPRFQVALLSLIT